MSTQLSPQIRVFALVGVLLIALAGAWLVLLNRPKPATVTVPTTAHTTTPAATTAHTTTPAATTATTPAKPAVSKVHVDPRLPAPIQAALERHPVVVVGLYDPQVHVDALTLAAARAGAAQAGVGFLPVDLLDDRVAGRLTALLPSGNLLPDPGLLVYRRPGKVVYRFDGYLDRDAVALAAATAR